MPSPGAQPQSPRQIKRGAEEGSDTRPAALRAIKSADDAYDADWKVQAMMFQHGKPVDGNTHLRRYDDLEHGWHALVQAYEPDLTYTDASNFGVALQFIPGPTFNPVTGGLTSAVRPYDAAWQGFRATYRNDVANVDNVDTIANVDNRPKVREYYGWKTAPTAFQRVQINGARDSTNPRTFRDFALTPDDYSWWKWHTGSRPPRTRDDMQDWGSGPPSGTLGDVP